MCLCVYNYCVVSCHDSLRRSKYTRSTATIILGKLWQCALTTVLVLIYVPVHVFYSSVETLQRLSNDKSIAAFLKLCQAKLNHLLLLGAYLLKPVQRVLKYSPLLRVSSPCELSLACLPSVSHLWWGWVVFYHLNSHTSVLYMCMLATQAKFTPLHLCSSLFALLPEHCQACWTRWCSIQWFTGMVLHLSSGICFYVYRTHPHTRPKNGKLPFCVAQCFGC